MQLFKLGNIDYSPFILRGGYKLGKAQTWTEGSGRDYAQGRWMGSILGNYTNPTVEIALEDSTMLSILETELLKGTISVSFYDTRTNSVRTRNFYRANYEVVIDGFYDEGADVDFNTIIIELVAHERD